MASSLLGYFDFERVLVFFEELVIKARSEHIHHKVVAESLGHYLTPFPLKESSKGRPLKVQMSFEILALTRAQWIENLLLVSEGTT